MSDTEQDPDGVSRGVMDGIREQLARAIDKVEAALDDMFDVYDELDPEEDERP